MEPITLITAALIAGATEMSKGALGEAGKQAYSSLKSRVAHLFAGDAHATQVLAGHDQDPDTYEKPLKKVLEKSRISEDSEAVSNAEELMSILNQDPTTRGRYDVHIDGGQGIQIGDHNNQENNFGNS